MKPTPVPHLLNFPSPEAITITSVLYKLPEHVEACYCMAAYFALLCILLFFTWTVYLGDHSVLYI